MEANNTKLTWAVFSLGISILFSGFYVGSSIRAGVTVNVPNVQQAIAEASQNMTDQDYASDQDVMDVSQAANYLKIPENQLQEIVDKGTLYDGKGIPHVKINNQLLFSKNALSQWVGESNYKFDY